MIFTPKSLLRAKAARSSVDVLTMGSFHEVIDDDAVGDPGAIQRVVFTAGKVALDAVAERDALETPVAIVRVEQLYPWPAAQIATALTRYPNAREIVWLQEEPENMGSWNFVKGRLYERHGDTHDITRISRVESGSPATGSATIHQQEQRALLRRAVTVPDR